MTDIKYLLLVLVGNTLWMIWRDLDYRKYRIRLSDIEKINANNQMVTHENYVGAKNEALYYKDLYEKLSMENRPKKQ